jgi:hypothetical protein
MKVLFFHICCYQLSLLVGECMAFSQVNVDNLDICGRLLLILMYLLCFLWLKIHQLNKFLLSKLINPLRIVLRFLCSPSSLHKRYTRWGTHPLLWWRLFSVGFPHYIRGQNAAMCCIDEWYGYLLGSQLPLRLFIRHKISGMLFRLIKLRQRLILKQMILTRWILNEMTRRGNTTTIIVRVTNYHTRWLLNQCGGCSHS